MSEESPRRSAVWIMGCMVLVAWVACGVYRREVPPLIVARAVLRVPAATDLETLCCQPEILQTAVELLEIEGDIFIALEQGVGKSRLSGELTACKLTNSQPANGADPSVQTTVEAATESWELTYRTPLQDRALGELTALITVLEQRLKPSETAVAESDDSEISQTDLLADQRRAIQQELQDLSSSESASDPVDPSQLVALQERVRSLQRSLTESQGERLQAEEEWRLVEQETRRNPRLDAVAAMLSAGPVQEAVLQLERQRKLSAELTRLNETEQRLENVYGDRHPKLVELRNRFEQLLADLGGWDQVLNETQMAERLEKSLEQVVQLKQQHEADLQTQLELGQSELLAFNRATEQRVSLTAQLEQLDRQLAASRTGSHIDTASKLACTIQEPPELTAPDWHADLTLLMACATSAGLILGWILHRIGTSASEQSPSVQNRRPPTPTFIPAPESQLDLAQRRALRQARLQQVYAS